MMNKEINLTIATSISGKGGISTVLQVLNAAGFFRDTNSKLIVSHSSGSRVKLLLHFMLSVLALCYYCIFYKVGIVHLHMASRGSYMRKSLLVRLAKFWGVKVIIHLHGAEFKEFYLNECSQKKQEHIRNTFNMADKVVVLSSQWLEWINTIVNDTSKTRVVYNAVPEVMLPEEHTKQPIILFLGRIGRRKGVEDLLKAYAKIAKKHPSLLLNLGGDGDLELYKKQAVLLGIDSQVCFLGWVSGVAKYQCLADATIYTLPSYNEGFPMGVLEAMSAGVAVVASRAGGIPDAIMDGKEGLLVDAGDIDALANALEKMLKDDVTRISYVNAAKEKYKNNFSPEVIVPQLKEIYNELLSAS